MNRLPPPPVGDRHGRSPAATGVDPVRLAGLLARAWLEIRVGQRPLAQIAPFVSPATRRRLATQIVRDRSHTPGASPARVRRLVDSSPAPGVHEVTVLVEHHGRTTAIAVRMERHRGSWRAVELMAPESGLRAIPTASVPSSQRPRDAFDEVFEDAGEPLPGHLQRPRGDRQPAVRRRGSA